MSSQALSFPNTASLSVEQVTHSRWFRWALLLVFSLLALRLEKRPLLHLGHALAVAGLVSGVMILLARSLTRPEWMLWGVLVLFLLGAEAHEARLYRKARATFLVCHVTPEGLVVVDRHGKANLRDVTIRLVDYEDLHALHAKRADDLADFQSVVQTVQLGNFLEESTKASQMQPLHAHGNEIRYHVAFTSDTGRWWEALRLQKTDDHWSESVEIWRLEGSHPVRLFQQADKDFPVQASELNWGWATDTL